ncbi:hypothetical protein LTR94_027479 [Friedmanniomyces endolithicus]|nr:hypothetical protein LTR94_027479 [Friedmanniomyces endolithicus]
MRGIDFIQVPTTLLAQVDSSVGGKTAIDTARDYFDWLSSDGAGGAHGEPAALEKAVVRSVEIKSAVVGQDEKEGGARALLNLGHTFGHAIETEVGFGEDGLAHGEAVALGCCMAFRYSVSEGYCPPEDALRLEAVTEAAGLPTRLSQAGEFSADRLIALMAGDKKAEKGALTLILARGIGRAFIAKGVDAQKVRAFLISEGARE